MRFPTLNLLSLILLQWPIVAHAQIIPDGTLSNPSIVTTNGNTQTITGGTGAANNLFHSFSQFSVNNGGTALFVHAPIVKNLFVRVTGNVPSRINGILRAQQNISAEISPANLFILNPSGISFGENASLDIRGSFFASTAESIRFSNNSEFSARNPTTPLLTIATPIGLQFGKNPGKITSQALLSIPNAPLGRLPYDRTLALLGGDIEISGNAVRAVPGGVELAALGENTNIGFTVRDDGSLNFDYRNADRWRDISFSNRSRAQVTANGRSINLLGRNITIASGSQVISGAVAPRSNTENAVTISAKNNLIITGDNSRILSAASNVGTGADIQVKAQNLLVEQRGNISTLVERQGSQGGNMIIDVDEQIILNGIQLTKNQIDRGQGNSGLFANSTNSGNSGNITVSGRILIMQNGANLNSLTDSIGKSGDITLKNFQDVTIIGAVTSPTNQPVTNSLLGLPTSISTKTQNQGNAGKLTISSQRLTVSDGAQVITSTTGSGNAGLLDITAKDVEVGGVATVNNQLLYQSPGNRLASNIVSDAQPNSTGKGALLSIKTDRLTVKDGAVIQTATFSSGDAGNIDIVANQSVRLEGIAPNPDDRYPSSIIAISGGLPGLQAFGVPTATGKGGQISITTPELKLTDGAQIAIGSLNPTPAAKGAGDRLTINADAIILDRAKLNAQTQSGRGGNMSLTANQLLLLRNNSQIITQAGSANQGGDGGDIDIRSPFIFAIDSENSDINANAFTGNGGNINLTATTILGLTPRNQLTPLSDITASSSFGRQGLIIVNSPEPDPNRGTVQLPNALTDPSDRIDQSCSANTTASGQFTVAGQGGLPSTPQTPISINPIARLANLQNTTKASKQPPSNLTIREAQQIKRLSNGKIRFMADVTQPAAPLLSGSKCQ